VRPGIPPARDAAPPLKLACCRVMAICEPPVPSCGRRESVVETARPSSPGAALARLHLRGSAGAQALRPARTPCARAAGAGSWVAHYSAVAHGPR
jgi:hypothetical protein